MGLLAILLPGRCAGCGRPGPPLCDRCDRDLIRVGPTGCARCGAPGPWPVGRCVECVGRRLAFQRARGAIAYRGVARTLVASWKEAGRRDLTAPLAELVVEAVPRPDVDLLTFVPGDTERGLKRGHVPAAGLARALGRTWALEIGSLLHRTDHRERQASMRLIERRLNARHAFAPHGHPPARVCLIDDVYTTGATASACATELRRAGARYVEVVCLARAVR